MIDLPQHAAQVAMLRDMLFGQTPWTDYFQINKYSPYWIGYGLALPFSLFLPIASALKLVLSAAYIAFVYMCVRIRKQVGADERLDWLFLLSFFGFAYTWGLYTYLVAAPIGLAFIYLSLNYVRSQKPSGAFLVLACGLALLLSHGLVFVFALSVGFCLALVRVLKYKASPVLVLPFIVLELVCLADYALAEKINSAYQAYLPTGLLWGSFFLRIPKIFLYSLLANPPGWGMLIYVPSLLILFAAPWLLGFRVNLKNSYSWVPFAVVVAILMLIPSFAFNTQFLWQRFSLFLIPAYAWMFTQVKKPLPAHGTGSEKLALPILMIMCWLMLGLHSNSAWRFAKETRDFDKVVAQMEPRQRVLGIVLDRDSEADRNIKVYAQYPAWYGAEKSGLVDFNFGWMPPLIVRYKLSHLPAVQPGFDWHPEDFDWNKNNGKDYRYFLVRSKALPDNLFKSAEHPPKMLSRSGEWLVYEQYLWKVSPELGKADR